MHPKQDDTRAPLAELPWLALTMVAQAIRLGRASNGYAAHAWRSQPIALSRLLSAALRHVAAFLTGADTDPKTGAHHLACAAFNVLAALELHQTTGAEVDDRWKPSREPDLSGVTAESIQAAAEQPAANPPPLIAGSSSLVESVIDYYDLSPWQVRGLRALRSSNAVDVRQTVGRRLIDAEPETVSIGAGTFVALPCEKQERPLWIAAFKHDDGATVDALKALGLNQAEWSSWESAADAECAAYNALDNALKARRKTVEAKA